jgi:WD40 repeat protein
MTVVRLGLALALPCSIAAGAVPPAGAGLSEVRAIPLATDVVKEFDQGFEVRVANGGKYAGVTFMIANGGPIELLAVDLEAGKVVAGAPPNRLGADAWAFGPRGDTLYVGGGGDIHVAIDLVGGRIATRDGNKVYSASRGKLRLPKYKTLLVSPDGRTLAAAVTVGAVRAEHPDYANHALVLLDPQANPDDFRVIAKVEQDFDPFWIGFSPDSAILAAVGHNGPQLLLWDLGARAALPSEALKEATSDRVASTPVGFSSDSKSLVYADAIYDLTSQKRVRTFDRNAGHEAEQIGIALSPAAAVYATFAREDYRTKKGELLLKSLADDAVLASVVASDGPVAAAAFSPDGKSLVTLGSDGGKDVVKVWAVGEPI